MKIKSGLLGIALLAVVAVGASAVPVQATVEASASYTPSGSSGTLTIWAWPGAEYEARTWQGAVVAAGVMPADVISLQVQNAGPGPQGTWLTLTVAGEPVEVYIDDPSEWEWDH